MPNCPQCNQIVDSQAITCPRCHKALKAFGHPGIPLHRATGEEFLCNSCTYHVDDTCTFPQRPYAKECTLYSSLNNLGDRTQSQKSLNWQHSIRLWSQRNRALLMLLGLGGVSFLLVMIRR